MKYYNDLRSFIDALDAMGDIMHVTREVDCDFEPSAITRRSYEIQSPAPICPMPAWRCRWGWIRPPAARRLSRRSMMRASSRAFRRYASSGTLRCASKIFCAATMLTSIAPYPLCS